jgi:hypothetical protein
MSVAIDHVTAEVEPEPPTSEPQARERDETSPEAEWRRFVELRARFEQRAERLCAN